VQAALLAPLPLPPSSDEQALETNPTNAANQRNFESMRI
jgi:hypothetical protein